MKNQRIVTALALIPAVLLSIDGPVYPTSPIKEHRTHSGELEELFPDTSEVKKTAWNRLFEDNLCQLEEAIATVERDLDQVNWKARHMGFGMMLSDATIIANTISKNARQSIKGTPEEITQHLLERWKTAKEAADEVLRALEIRACKGPNDKPTIQIRTPVAKNISRPVPLIGEPLKKTVGFMIARD